MAQADACANKNTTLRQVGAYTYNSTIIPASLYSIISDSKNHNNFWTEKDANAWATWFFGKNSEIGKAQYLPKEFSYLMNNLINH